MKNIIIALIASIIALSANESFIDNFSNPELKDRQAQRGEWKFADNTASCISSKELYNKYHNHGPILKWPRDCTSGTIEFKIKTNNCSRFVFTLNGDGHIFRVCLADKSQNNKWIKTRAIAWATKSSKENKGDSFHPEGMPDLSSINNQWIQFKLSITGEKGYLQIGNFSNEINHKAFSRKKNTIMASFAHGDFAIKNFKFTPKN